MGSKKKAAEEVVDEVVKTIEIRGAKIKDDFCNYTYELKTGPTAGDALNRSGASIIHEDLKAAFKKLNPHLAVICEEVDSNKINDIADYEALDLMGDYRANSIEKKMLSFFVTQFLIEGSGKNESVTLIGFKRLSTGDDLQLKTPKIKWAGVYQFVDELRATIDVCIAEVEEYMNGKTAPKMVQQAMEFEEVVETEETE